ncbi:hypothetical protein AAF712_003444 [Marasmius tenuissimus]|uniref:Uncharacterized protein n=1 Tax=Marasmius tenuissimus TaxID=585030 RepID=A0ABR3A7X0_9AGAR
MQLSRTSFFTLLTIVALTSSATVEKRKNVDRPDPASPDHCPGLKTGDADRCTFENAEAGPDKILTQIVGDPVDNCKGGITDLKTTIGGDKSVSQTWKYGVSVGFEADGGDELPIGASFESSDSWSNTETKTFRQNIEVTIKPGQKAALIAKITAKTFVGRLRINYGDPTGEAGKNDYHYEWYNNDVGSVQPTDQVVYDQKIVNCDQDI